MTDREQRAATLFLQASLETNPYYHEHRNEGRYRYEHSLRVAKIGRTIAMAEGFDPETLTLSCLLHDIAYMRLLDADGLKEHGRIGAAIARPFLSELALPSDTIDVICHGIAIHVDFRSDNPKLDSALTRSVAEADNIDRVGPILLCRQVESLSLSQLPAAELIAHCGKQLAEVARFRGWKMSTPTAQQLWEAGLSHREQFYRALQAQAQGGIG